ncbi:MAG TPA: DUF1080 domain-containing protein [Bryobacteraceae bacterium]|nr:DUF1080 domain-containing protein [Bryobacteraceae bacterium]
MRPVLVAVGCLAVFVAPLLTQQKPPRKGGGFEMELPQPLKDETGFRQIFDGKTLTGWDGDPKLWRVENGAIVGETTAQTMPKQNSFLIWRGGSPADFELKLQYRLGAVNSGIQYRSIELPNIRWAMKGYQADIDAEDRFTGQIYEERGRGFLALRGQFNYVPAGKKPGVVGSLGDGGELKSFIQNGGWNDYDIIARGNVLVQVMNGHVMSGLVDDDVPNRKMSGLIGIQLHLGPPMKVEVRNIRLKTM